MSEVKVSVIIPVYNTEKYVEETLKSVLAQSLKEIEIICINDGSADGSLGILRKYERLDSRVRVFDRENQGQGAERNFGLHAAAGEYVYFLDSDDLLDEHALEIMYMEVQNVREDVLIINGQTFYDTDELREKFASFQNFYMISGYQQIKNGKDMFADMMLNYDFRLQVSLFFYRREYLIAEKIDFPEKILHEDNLFCFFSVFKASRVRHIETPLFKRRIRDNSVMTTQSSVRNMYGYYYTAVELIKYLHDFEFESRPYHAVCCLIKNCMKQAEHIGSHLSENERRENSNIWIEPSWMGNVFEKLESDYRKAERENGLCTRQKAEIERLSGVRDEIYAQLKDVRSDVEKKNKWLLEKDERIKETEELLRKSSALAQQRQDELHKTEKQLQSAKDRIQCAEEKLRKAELTIKKEEEKVRGLTEEIERLKNSFSYKLGRDLTFVPRKLRTKRKGKRYGAQK